MCVLRSLAAQQTSRLEQTETVGIRKGWKGFACRSEKCRERLVMNCSEFQQRSRRGDCREKSGLIFTFEMTMCKVKTRPHFSFSLDALGVGDGFRDAGIAAGLEDRA